MEIVNKFYIQNNLEQQMFPRQNFLLISADYKFRKTPHRFATQKKPKRHSRNTESLLQYRAYDKQRLLQQIDKKISKKNIAISQNKQLKQQIDKIVGQNVIPTFCTSLNTIYNRNTGTGKWDRDNLVANTRVYSVLMSLKEQNEKLKKQKERKQLEVQKMKKSQQYCEFQQILAECLVFKEQLQRLKNIAKQRKKKRLENKRIKARIRNQKINQILNQERGIQFLNGHSTQLKQNLNTVCSQIQLLKNKNKQILKTKKRLLDEIDNIRERASNIQGEGSFTKLRSSGGSSMSSTLTSMAHQKPHKTASPTAIIQLQQQQYSDSPKKIPSTNPPPLHPSAKDEKLKMILDQDNEQQQQRDSIESEASIKSKPEVKPDDDQ